MFQLTDTEFKTIQSQIVTGYGDTNLKSQIVTSSWGGTRKLPFAFTEQGVAMLSGVLRSERAINMNIAIMRAFVDVRKILFKQNNINEQLSEIKERLGEHDIQLNELYDAMDNMLDAKIAQLKWKDRERIGFKMKEY
ncbi:ORF6N domain-containing protein [Pedobacter frigidisoli]|uniref:ORF6N domain-containing protein n=1 Tax=Pedobacter frigidisoli TaxID=2530455 RepID=UPI001CED8515|nr:ORF6N domain-containing protein [Pedobacter frigidisoli]